MRYQVQPMPVSHGGFVVRDTAINRDLHRAWPNDHMTRIWKSEQAAKRVADKMNAECN